MEAISYADVGWRSQGGRLRGVDGVGGGLAAMIPAHFTMTNRPWGDPARRRGAGIERMPLAHRHLHLLAPETPACAPWDALPMIPVEVAFDADPGVRGMEEGADLSEDSSPRMSRTTSGFVELRIRGKALQPSRGLGQQPPRLVQLLAGGVAALLPMSRCTRTGAQVIAMVPP